MTKYIALSRLVKPGSNKYIEAGELVPKVSREVLQTWLNAGRIGPAPEKAKEAKGPATVTKVFGSKLAKAMADKGILGWLELSFVTDKQLLSVEGITKDNLKEIRAKIPKE